MKLFIPEIGTDIVLSEDWTFNLYNERRNAITCVMSGFKENAKEFDRINREKRENGEISWEDFWSLEYSEPLTLPRGTRLRVDRVYIRKGASDFSSVTFRIMSCPLKFLTLEKDGGTFPKYQHRRFWAKLDDVNKIEFEDALS